jgi:hypothetical protein
MAILSAQHLAPALGEFEPQRKYNWTIEIALDDTGDQVIIMRSLLNFSGIVEETEEIAMEFANEVRYVPGKTRFDEATLALRDFVDIGTKNAIIKWRRQVYNAETGSTGLASILKKNASLVLTSPDGSINRVWKLIGVWPKRVAYGDLNMEGSELNQIEVTLRYDRAVPGEGLNTGLGGVNVGVI